MRKILIAGLMQETNCFSPVIYDINKFTKGPLCGEGFDFVERNRGKGTSVAAMVDVVEAHGDEIIPVLNYLSNSGGRVETAVAETFISAVLEAYRGSKPDAMFLSFHAGMALTTEDDGVGYILEKLRAEVGPDMFIAMSSDLHANITAKIIANANIITGYQTYPHDDYYMTGKRAAELAYLKMDGGAVFQAAVILPMLVPAESYDTISGPFAELVNETRGRVESGEILDFTIYMMQPWLNVDCAGSTVIITADTKEKAASAARETAEKLWSLRHEFKVRLYSLDETIDAAVANESGKPVILVDSADSQGAGSEADSSQVLSRLIERGYPVKAALHVHDAAAVQRAFRIGVGGEADFTVGGSYDKVFQKPCIVRGVVRSLHNGEYELEGPAEKGVPQRVGPTAVIRIHNIDLILFTAMGRNSDPQLYRAFGVEPRLYKLVMVKSASQYKVAYRLFTDLFYPTDTVGASSANLTAMPFDRIVHPFWPFEDVPGFRSEVLFTR